VEANVAPDQAVALDRGSQVIRLVVVWGARFLGEVLAEMLGRDPAISVRGVCTDLSEAVVSSEAAQADVVLIDARLPDGTAAVRRALEIVPGMRIIVSAVRETEEDIVAWAEAGVIGYIPRTTAMADFVRLVLAIHNGEQLSSGRIVTGLMRRIALSAKRRPSRDAALPAPVLTKRERQTAELIRSGLSDKEIARQLNISLATTKSHVHNLLGKLHAQRRSQVAEWLQDYERRPGAPAARPLLDGYRSSAGSP
jgi:two-component system, NarL family, nitrate/nitrite response regulator NarL